MKHILDLDGAGLIRLQNEVFTPIADRETILFLGAGASITNKKYLSNEIIDLYSAKLGIDLETQDIIEFVDTLSADPDFSRDDFDDFVDAILRKLNVTNTHKIIASLPWKEIITTNYDLLIEKAFDVIKGTSNENLSVKTIRKSGEYRYNSANDEVKYVKLNGCISDKKQYPLVFSTRDFESSKQFYRTVLTSLDNLSPRINFLSVGYSFSDIFAKSLLKRFDNYNFAKRWMYSIEPYPKEAMLPYFESNKICIVKITAEQFFEEYEKWEATNRANLVARKHISFSKVNNKKLQIPDKIALRVSNNLAQLTKSSASTSISPKDFYFGEQPTFDVIRKNLDVVKTNLVSQVKHKLLDLLSTKDTLVNVLLLTGSYGTGKTTFCYRVMEEMIKDETKSTLAFEISDPAKLNIADLEHIFNSSEAENIILFFNGIEVDSSYKALIDFRVKLSIEQFNNFNIIVLASIRENILDRHLNNNKYKNFQHLNIDISFNEQEALDLIEKLHEAGVIQYRDAREKNTFIRKVIDDYSGDTLISLICLISDSNHSLILRDAYNQLSPKAQEVFMYTSLLYRFGLLISASLLQKLTSKTWEEFTKDILKYDSKGILIQEINNTVGTDPDLYFRTKHPIISDSLVNLLLPSEDEKFSKYNNLFNHLYLSSYNAKLVVDLLRAISDNKDLGQEKINKLYDISSQHFAQDPHFTLHYAINLQYRNDENSFRKAIDKIKFAESFLEHRNSRLIHRRAVLNFRIAKVLFNKEIELKETYKYVSEARLFFGIKLVLDPFSSFSYVDYLAFELWYLENFKLNEIDELRQRIKIEELLDKAESSVLDNIDKIIRLRAKYLQEIRNKTGSQKEEYLNYLNDLYHNPDTKPFSLILQYYYYDCEKTSLECREIIKELQDFLYLDEAAKVLFRYYGRNLHSVDNRVKLFDLLRKHKEIEKNDPLRYHYYSYVAESYNMNFYYSYDHLNTLRSQYYNLNPTLNETWKNSDTGQQEIFEGYIVQSKGRKKIKITDLQQTFDLIKVGNHKNSQIVEGSMHHVHLHFFIHGIRAEIIKFETND